jgi:hypothetical protein
MLPRKLYPTKAMVEIRTQRNPTTNPMERPVREATISRKAIHVESTRESMTGANAQTINSPRTLRGTMVESLSILKELKQRRKLHSRRNPRTKPTSFKKRESQAWENFRTLYKTKTITR